jgi:hypothetical protein
MKRRIPLGTTRPNGRCRLCDEPLEEVYNEYSSCHIRGRHNMVEGWRPVPHDTPEDCIRYLAEEIKALREGANDAR